MLASYFDKVEPKKEKPKPKHRPKEKLTYTRISPPPPPRERELNHEQLDFKHRLEDVEDYVESKLREYENGIDQQLKEMLHTLHEIQSLNSQVTEDKVKKLQELEIERSIEISRKSRDIHRSDYYERHRSHSPPRRSHISRRLSPDSSHISRSRKKS